MKILPLDLASGEASIREAVEKAESFFPESGVDYMIHNAACERPVCILINLIVHFEKEVPCIKNKKCVMIIICFKKSVGILICTKKTSFDKNWKLIFRSMAS